MEKILKSAALPALAALLSFAFCVVSCVSEITDPEQLRETITTFHASFEQPVEAPGTRTYCRYDDGPQIRWHDDDKISIFNHSTGEEIYKFMGDTGDTTGDFEKDGSNVPEGEPTDLIYAVYPQQISRLKKDDQGYFLEIDMPRYQNTENTDGASFSQFDNTMVSVGSTENLSFRNVCGYLGIKMRGAEEMTTTDITLRGNNGEAISGVAEVRIDENGIPVCTMVDRNTEWDNPQEIKVSHYDTLYPDEDIIIFFVVPPVTFEKGFTVNIDFPLGFHYTIRTDKTITIKRNTLTMMESFVAQRNAPDPIDLGLSVKWSPVVVGSESYSGGHYFAFGELETDENYDWASYKWADGAANALTKYCTSPSSGKDGFADYKRVLDEEDDVAHQYFGDKWRMPTRSEWQELVDNCTWTRKSGVITATSKLNGNSIKFYANGGYLTADDNPGFYSAYFWMLDMPNGMPAAFYVGKNNNEIGFYDNMPHCNGLQVRPVYGDRIKSTQIRLYHSGEPVENGSTIQVIDGIGDAIFLGATAVAGEKYATDRDVIFEVADPSVVALTQEWCSEVKLTPLKKGTTTVTATANDGGASATLTVEVIDIPGVDMGLPSGTRWAECNYGASSPEQSGTFISWGELTAKDSYSAENYAPVADKDETQLYYNNEPVYQKIGYKYCRLMPTSDRFNELFENCITTWTAKSGIPGVLFESKLNGHSIFFPATGWYEGSSIVGGSSAGACLCADKDEEHMNQCRVVFLEQSNLDGSYYSLRLASPYWGYPVRPVYRDTSDS